MVDEDKDFLGARFYKADLHVHSSASKDWSGKRGEEELSRLFKKLGEEEIGVVAITDHNSAGNIDEAKRLGKQCGIQVFPGVEVSTKEGHVLAIFEPKKSQKEIEGWLAKMGFVGAKLGDLDALAEDQDGSPLEVTKVFGVIENHGGVAIAPHPNSKGTGFLEVMKQKGIARKMAYESPFLRGMEVGENREKILKLASGSISGYKKKYGCIASSDAHRLEDIGKTFTYIKMGDFSISALKQVFYDPAMRIRFSDEWPPKAHAWIERLEVSQGFFDGVTFRFHPDMNCLVGGKAVGKSLLIELIKFGLGVESPIEGVNEDSREMLDAKTCLGDGGTVTLHVVSDNGEKYRVQRTLSDLDEGPEVWYENTEAKAASDVKDVFQCKVYSQNEVIELGKTLPALVDWLDGFIDLSGERVRIEELRRNARLLLSRLDKHHNIAKNVASLKKKKGDLDTKKGHLEKMIKKPILKSFPKWQKEERLLRRMQLGMVKLKSEIVEVVKKVNVGKYIPEPEEGTPNYKEIFEQREVVIQMTERFQELGEQLEEAVVAKEKGLEGYIVHWREEYDKARKKHEEVIKTAGVKNAYALTSELGKAVEAIEGVEAELDEAREAAKRKKAIETELRSKLIPEYSNCFGDIFKKRLDKATAITESLGSFVRIRVLQMSDRTKFERAVEAFGKGSRLRGPELRQIAAKVMPVELAELVLDKNAEQLGGKTGLKRDKMGIFIENAWAKSSSPEGLELPSRLYRMMLTELRDSVTVELNVGGGVYKPMNELSVGSKCTAILSVALVEGDCPLVVDQPEDALDNPFVFDQIVKTVRRSKLGRQYVFATHNPNVAVSSDADLIYCLRATADAGGVEKQGSIDEILTKDKVVANLEGGRSAFRLRSQKYDIVVDDPTAVVLDVRGSVE